MSRNTKTSSLTEAAIICGILVLMSMISFYILPFVDFLFPLPAIILGKRRGYKYSALSMVAASLIIMMFLGLPSGILYLVMYTPLGIFMSYFICKMTKPSITILCCSFIMLISLVVMLFLTEFLTGVKFIDEIVASVDRMVEMQKSMFQTLGGNLDQLEILTQTLDSMSKSIVFMLPSVLILAAVMITYANYFLVQKLASRFKLSIYPINDLMYFALPTSFLYGMGALLVLTFAGMMFNFPNMDIIMMNISMLIRMALLLQGLALVKYYLVKNNVSTFVKVLIFIMIIFMPILTGLVTILAIVDLIADFRRLRLK